MRCTTTVTGGAETKSNIHAHTAHTKRVGQGCTARPALLAYAHPVYMSGGTPYHSLYCYQYYHVYLPSDNVQHEVFDVDQGQSIPRK